MRFSAIIGCILLGCLSACVTMSDHPPQKRPDFSKAKEAAVTTSSAVTSSCTCCVTSH